LKIFNAFKEEDGSHGCCTSFLPLLQVFAVEMSRLERITPA